MRRLTLAALPLALGLAVSGCTAKETERGRTGESGTTDSGPQTTRDYALSDFSAVSVTGPDDLRITMGEGFSISATGPQAEIDELEIERDGDRLSIGRRKNGSFFGGRNHVGVKIAVTMPRLTAVRLTGSGEVEADAMEGDAVEAVVTGSGDLKVARLTAKSVSMAISGSGDIDVDSGTVDSSEYRVTGSGNIEAEGLAARTLDISITGSGDVEARASEAASVSIMGSGDASVVGGAKCSSRTLGSGEVRCR